MAKSKKGKRTPKGRIAIFNRNGMLYLRIPFNGTRKALAVGLCDTPHHRIKAQELATRIEKDIVSDTFDSTLEKYRPKKKSSNTVNLFEQFIAHRLKSGTSGQTISSKYKPMLSNLIRFGKNITTETLAREFMEFLRSRQSDLIWNQSLALLKSFGAWAKLDPNPFAPIAPIKVATYSRKAFTQSERKKILDAFASHHLYSHYYSFVYVLFALGLRPSEAIGLQWKDIDFERRTITISESLSRSPSGKSSGEQRVRKTTKTGNVRKMPMNDGLLSVFLSLKEQHEKRKEEEKEKGLVFLTKNGRPIDDHVFSQRIWKTVLKGIDIPYRPPYSCRHTFASDAIEKNLSVFQVSAMLGHTSSEMVIKTYGHMLTTPELPEI